MRSARETLYQHVTALCRALLMDTLSIRHHGSDAGYVRPISSFLNDGS